MWYPPFSRPKLQFHVSHQWVLYKSIVTVTVITLVHSVLTYALIAILLHMEIEARKR